MVIHQEFCTDMKQTDNFVLRQIADETILVPCGSMAEHMDQVITLSDTAVYIYEQVPTVDSMEDFLMKMGKEYQMEDIEQLRQDVQEVLDFMIKNRILEYSDAVAGW